MLPYPMHLTSYLLLSTLVLSGYTFALPVHSSGQAFLATPSTLDGRRDTKVLILGGGVAGVTAARALYEQGVTDFMIVEARGELGGRLTSQIFGAPGRQYTVEVGANWVQGTQTGGGTENPIWALAKKHNIITRQSNYSESISAFIPCFTPTMSLTQMVQQRMTIQAPSTSKIRS